MRMAQRKREGCESSLKTSGEEIWYGMLATHRLKKGRSSLSTSEWMSCSLCTIGVDDTRFCRAADEAGAADAEGAVGAAGAAGAVLAATVAERAVVGADLELNNHSRVVLHSDHLLVALKQLERQVTRTWANLEDCVRGLDPCLLNHRRCHEWILEQVLPE